jgi:hypothetical protein
VAHARNAVYRHGELVALIWKLIRKNLFDPADFVLAGSARLLRDAVIEHASDLDVVARGATFANALTLAHLPEHDGLTIGENTGDKIAQLFGGRINVSARWLDREASIDDLIEGAEVLDGLRYFRIDDVIAYKTMLDRPKDRADLAALAESRCAAIGR